MRVHKAPAAGNTAQMTDRWDETETRQGFQLCEVAGNEISVSFVPAEDQSPIDDARGPSGHPRLEERDYSLAREKPPPAPDPWLLEDAPPD